jgi:hypothetical protein
MTRYQETYLLGGGAVKYDISLNSDGVFRRTTVTDNISMTTDTYTTNPVNEYTQINMTLRQHDANGNLIDDGTYEYRYDPMNNLCEIILKQTQRLFVEYNYDGLNRMVEKKKYDPYSGMITDWRRYTWRGMQLLSPMIFARKSHI